MKHASGWIEWGGTVVSILASFILMIMASRTLPVGTVYAVFVGLGTAYAVWTGIGASGGAILGMIFYSEPRNAARVLFIAMVLGSAVGLKLVS